MRIPGIRHHVAEPSNRGGAMVIMACSCIIHGKCLDGWPPLTQPLGWICYQGCHNVCNHWNCTLICLANHIDSHYAVTPKPRFLQKYCSTEGGNNQLRQTHMSQCTWRAAWIWGGYWLPGCGICVPTLAFFARLCAERLWFEPDSYTWALQQVYWRWQWESIWQRAEPDNRIMAGGQAVKMYHGCWLMHT